MAASQAAALAARHRAAGSLVTLGKDEYLLPGLVDLHVHAPQWPQLGLALDLPLDLRGTAFQQRVWRALRQIPPGETRTYGEVATAIGDPRAVRAVARSCATNPVSLAVPCHRVIGKDGALTGYRWGVPRKRALLEKERAAAGKAAA